MGTSLRIAFAFLTRLPVPLPQELPAEKLAGASSFFPLVGWFYGGAMGLLAWAILAAGSTSTVAAVLAVAFSAWLSRGLHLDGVADLCDGLGGSHEPVRRLAIMKDSACGPFGVVGLVLLLLGKVAVLAALFDNGLVTADGGWLALAPAGFAGLLAGPVGGRFAMAALACGSRYPRESGTGHAFVGRVTGRHLAMGGLFLLPLLAVDFLPALAGIGAAQLPALWLRAKCNRALGGITGDVLGASCELGEAAGWLAAALCLAWTA
ncbi:MAG: adenosylcobinamide-GDP ribazoletransferase [Desulfobulbaceae bacterium]|nr:adenosylcobinamide-GDP ribazoletransferase [Desulfobulbaceae bacterium]